MTALIDQPAVVGRGSYLRSEIRRLGYRRAPRWIAVGGLIVMGLILALMFVTFTQPSVLDPSDASFEVVGPIYSMAKTLPDSVLVVGAGLAALAFLAGVTWIGADWSTRTLVLQATWEPRRLRMILTKMGVLAVAVVAYAAIAQILWLLGSVLLATTRGDTTVGPEFWGNLLQREWRLLVFVLLAAVGGLALCTLLRNASWCLGLAFLYVVVGEGGVRMWGQSRPQWLLSENALAWVQPRGRTLSWYETVPIENDRFGYQLVEHSVHLSSGRGLAYLLVVTGAILALALWAFRRRDLA